MSDNSPNPGVPVTLGMDEAGVPQVVIGKSTVSNDLAEILAQAPALKEPAGAEQLALVVNHLKHSRQFRVITDPAAFESAYRARLASEDLDPEWQEGVIRLSDYGVPDFAEIQRPTVSGDTLRFYAEERRLGVPYRADLAPLTGDVVYEPLPLTPVPPPATRVATAAAPLDPQAGVDKIAKDF